MSLFKDIKPKIDKHEIISFDVFDTLLLRPYVKPTDLFLHLEKLEETQGFAKARIEAEQKARKIHSDVEDITLDEIYAEIADEYRNLKSKEMDLEQQVLQPNPEMKEVFDYAKKQGKKIIIISDMYLPAKFLTDILHKKGFDGFEKLYVSCEYRKTKHTGSLYKLAIDDLRASANDIFHIGDNPDSDKQKAEKLKISAYLYPKMIEQIFAENKRAKIFYDKNSNNLETSVILGMLTLNPCSSNYWQDFGYKYAGPVILGYMQWLEKQLKKDKISEVMFVARDGYTLEKVFNLVKTKNFKTHYFYAPRSMNLACNLNYEFNCNLGEEHGLAGLKTLLHYYQDKDEFLRKNTPQIKTSAEGIKFIEDNRKLFEKLAQKEKKMYAKYFEQFKLKTQKIAMIDTCSVFLSAQKALIAVLPNKKVKGYYWFTWEGLQEDIDKYETKTYQQSHKQEFANWGIMELFMTAPTPPVKEINDGKVIFKQINQNEASRIKIYPDLSQGAVNFAQKYLDVFGKYSVNFSCETLINWINILCNFATPTDKEHFIELRHAGDPEHTEWQPLMPKWFMTEQNCYDSTQKTKKLYLFGLSLFKIKKTMYRYSLRLFNFIPLISMKSKNNKQCFYLFGISLFQIKRENKINKSKTTLLLFKFLPIISIKRK